MDKELKIKTHWKAQTTWIHFGINEVFEDRFQKFLEEQTRKCAVIIDTNIEKLYMSSLEKFNVKVFPFSAEEHKKTRETKILLEDHLLSHKFNRNSLLIGIGGGIVTDLSGFIASTYCRGIPHIQIPTSLLAMVDASIGGKTAVNTLYGKNMIGTFYPPKQVWIDGMFLHTLPKKQWLNGIVEILKTGLAFSPSLFESMKKHYKKWEKKDLFFIMDRIFESVSIKADIVENDPKEEKGLRRILNLGHTFGHVIETLENFHIAHGEAVAIGILVSCFISHQMGILSQETFEEIKNVFHLYKIPLKLKKPFSIDAMMATLALDKKALKASPRMVLLESIGKVAPFDGEYCVEIPFPLIEKAITWMHEHFIQK